MGIRCVCHTKHTSSCKKWFKHMQHVQGMAYQLLTIEHSLQISLETGGTLEKGLMQTVCESAPKQRLHTAIDSPDGFIHVMLNDLRSLPSDKYNSHVFSYARPSQNGFGLHHTGTGMQGFASESRAFLGMAGGHRPSSMDEDEPMNLSQTDSETSEYTSAPSPLMPYAGFNRSPVSPAQAKTSQVFHDWHVTQPHCRL